MTENWGVTYRSTPQMLATNRGLQTFIQYADLADLVKMLNLKTGGSFQDAVNEAQALGTPAK